MSITIKLNKAGDLEAEFPGAEGAVRALPLRPGCEVETLIYVLQAQARAERGIGTDAEPTSAQFHHWQFHRDSAKPGCPFCRDEASQIAHGNVPLTRLAARSRRIQTVYRTTLGVEILDA
jgi:hypothetical protein